MTALVACPLLHLIPSHQPHCWPVFRPLPLDLYWDTYPLAVLCSSTVGMGQREAAEIPLVGGHLGHPSRSGATSTIAPSFQFTYTVCLQFGHFPLLSPPSLSSHPYPICWPLSTEILVVTGSLLLLLKPVLHPAAIRSTSQVCPSAQNLPQASCLTSTVTFCLFHPANTGLWHRDANLRTFGFLP